MRRGLTDPEFVDAAQEYFEIQGQKKQAYLDFAEDLEQQVDDGEMTERAATLILQLVITAEEDDDWQFAKRVQRHARMFPQWEPESLLIEDEELEELN